VWGVWSAVGATPPTGPDTRVPGLPTGIFL
jgi:hypothetical protein